MPARVVVAFPAQIGSGASYREEGNCLEAGGIDFGIEFSHIRRNGFLELNSSIVVVVGEVFRCLGDDAGVIVEEFIWFHAVRVRGV